MATMVNDGAVNLYYDNASKLATTNTGVDITGTLTSDGLTVDATVPTVRLDSPETAWAGGEDLGGVDWYTKDTSGSGPAVMARIYSESSGTNALPIPNMIFQTSLADVALKDRMKISGNGDISFYEDTGTTAKLTWDASAEMLTTSGLTVDGSATINTSSTALANFNYFGATKGSITTDGINLKHNATANMYFNVNSANRMQISGIGDISFYEDTGTTAKFFWDAADESLGLGATSFAGETLRMERSGDMIVGLFSGASSSTFLNMGTTSNRDIGQIGYTQSTNHMFFRTNDAERMRIDSSGVVDIKNVGSEASPSLIFGGDDDTGLFKPTSNILAFSTFGSEAMRIDSSGNLLVGVTGTGDLGTTNQGVLLRDGFIQVAKTGTTSTKVVYFYNGNGEVGSISTSGSATAYTTSSDYRLKTDAQPMTGASARVQALNPVNFEWIADGTRVDGFLAHEAQEVVPEAVTGTKDAVDADGNPEYQGIDQSKLVPLLTAALQEALTKIDALETRITALEG